MENNVLDGINITVTRKRIKNMYIKVTPPNGDVLVSIPYRASETEVSNFISSHELWIKKHVSNIRERERLKPQPNQYKNGESVELLGALFPLSIIEIDKKPSAVFESGIVILYVRHNSTYDERALLMRKLYCDILEQILPELILKDEAIVGKHANEWRFRDMKTRWGVCNVQHCRITLNTRLAARPKECIDYVIIHELTHLIEKSHSAVFKAYLDKFCPNWRIIRKRLNGK